MLRDEFKNKKTISIILLIVMSISLLSFSTVSVLGNDTANIVFYSYGDSSKPETKIVSKRVEDMTVISFPAAVSSENIVLYWDGNKPLYLKGPLGTLRVMSGQAFNLHSLCYPGEYIIEYMDKVVYGFAGEKLKINFLKNIPTVYLTSQDPVTNGRWWVESSLHKSNKATGSVIMQKADGNVVYSGGLTQRKGRGNTTWGFLKKPYQIKLSEKADLLETGNSDNKSKTWVLLANFLDPAGVRNSLALNLGNALGMPSNIQSKSVDLFYDGEYRGLYLLSEKVETGSGRVDVTNLEDENQSVNGEVDFETLPVKFGTTLNGAKYTYCDGMKSPSDISGGYLLEMDYEERALEEVCYIKTKRGFHVVVKSPEYASREEMDYIAGLYQEYEDALFSGGINQETGKKFSDYVDVRSVACYYLVNEVSKARDCFLSSAYLHKKAGEDKLYMGPLWDYDMSFGRASYGTVYYDDSPYGISLLDNVMCKTLLENQEFYTVVKDVYLNDFYPLIRNVILGDVNASSETGDLKSLAYYRENLKASGEANSELWYDNENWDADIDVIYNFLDVRSEELRKYLASSYSITYLPENSYYDVMEDSWYYDSVTKASQMGILKGMNYGFFGPHANVTRAQAVQAIYNKSGIANIPYVNLFNDVGPDDWFANAATWAHSKQLIYPDVNGLFEPEKNITREEFIQLLYRLSGSPEATTNYLLGYSDKESITSKKAVEWALSGGILKGADGMINPKGYMTRAEFAAILVRYYSQIKS